MASTIVVCGYGPGISDAVARKFGAEGFNVALVARSAERVAKGATALADNGVKAQGFACDLGDADAVAKLIADVRSALGPVTVIHYNAYAGVAGDLLSCDVSDLRKVFDVGVTGLVVALQASLPDMKGQDGSAVLITGGGFAYYDDKVDHMVVQFNAAGLALAKAAQHKLAGVLSKRLASDGVFVGEVVVLGMVKGTAFDSGQASLEPDDIAAKFWELYQTRTESSVRFG
jgi:NADP-dependent 3-hydroxy acid dehydrogenase YdfG